jgi:replicative DNA helicase
MVIVDGFNLMQHGGGKLREAMTRTSRQFRQLCGRYGVVGLVIHQTPGASEKEGQELDASGVRTVRTPKLTDYSETIALIQDAATVLTFDQSQGIGRLSIEKAREPSVGQKIELLCDFNMGYIHEQDVTGMF